MCVAPMWYGEITRSAPARRSFVLRVVGLDAGDDEEIRPHHPRGQHRVDVLGVGADRGDQAAGAMNAHALEHLVAAGVGGHREPASLQHRLHALGARAR